MLSLFSTINRQNHDDSIQCNIIEKCYENSFKILYFHLELVKVISVNFLHNSLYTQKLLYIILYLIFYNFIIINSLV